MVRKSGFLRNQGSRKLTTMMKTDEKNSKLNFTVFHKNSFKIIFFLELFKLFLKIIKIKNPKMINNKR